MSEPILHADLDDLLLAVFRSDGAAIWANNRNQLLRDADGEPERPCDLVADEAGRERVEGLLTALAEGVVF